jgi:RNA polymerase sigma-70 factor (ECF subfamily)
LNDRVDENAIRACRPGDKAAYAELVRRHYRHVFALCLGLLGHVHDAEDVAQETMLKGFASIRHLARPEQFESWILRIARNLCVDLLRRRKRAKTVAAAPELVPVQEVNENHDLERALHRLPQELRLPLTMYYLEQRDTKSIAEKLGISPSLTYQRIREARQRLHELLTERDTHA